MKQTIRRSRRVRALLSLSLALILLLLSACDAGSGGVTEGETTMAEVPAGTSVDAGTTAGETDPPTEPAGDGKMIYYEDFDGYGDVSGTEETLLALRANGVWTLDDKTDPYYGTSLPYASSSTCRYALRDGKLQVMGLTDENGTAISGASDTYLIVEDENYLWELMGQDYTIRYDVSYESYANPSRYIGVLWNYYGRYYSTFHLRVNGTGNLQVHKTGAWLDMDRYTASTDLYAPSLDEAGGGSSIAKKLLGVDLAGNGGTVVFTDMTVTVCIRVSSDGTSAVFLKTEGSDFIEVTRYDENSEVGDGLNSHLSLCNGGALAIKTGAGINGTIDNLMVYTGHGGVPEEKTVTYDPGEPPEIKYETEFTQERVLANDVYAAYSAFNAAAQPEYIVPALKQGMIPQGMDVWTEKNAILISGYFRDATYSPSSAIVAVDLESGEMIGGYTLKNIDGSYHTSHVGGIAVTETNIFLANGGTLYRIPLSELEAAGESGTLTIVEEIKTPTSASFCNYSDGVLWVGDFYLAGTYDTPEWRHLQNDKGQEFGAWCVGYRLSDETASGISASAWTENMEYATPDLVLAIEARIQGFAVVGDTIALSRSYGRTNNSGILLFEDVTKNAGDRTVQLNGKWVPVWILDSDAAIGSYTTMPMTEGLAVHEGDLLILFESGATYYKDNGGKNPTDRVWRMKLSE